MLILSKWPVEKINLEVDSRRVLCIRAYRPDERPILIFNTYLHSADTAAPVDLGKKVFEAAESLGEQCMIIGDFNREPEQTPVATAVATGRWQIPVM